MTRDLTKGWPIRQPGVFKSVHDGRPEKPLSVGRRFHKGFPPGSVPRDTSFRSIHDGRFLPPVQSKGIFFQGVPRRTTLARDTAPRKDPPGDKG